MLSNRSGNSGLYFRVLKFDSEYGLSLEVYGRLCVLVTAEVGEQELHRLGALRRAAVGVQRQHLGGDLLLLDRLLDQRLGELRVLPVLDGPADDVAAVLFPGALCARQWRRAVMAGAHGWVAVLSGT
jgi:hypothetical protein